MKIHPTAIVDKKAQVAEGVEIGPYSIIGPHVRIGAGTVIANHVVIDGYTTIGARCQIFSGACLGGVPQDKKFKECRSYLEIGDENTIREYVTMNRGSSPEAKTVIGDRNYFMIASHVGHDCTVGSDITIANCAALGGFAVVEDKAVLGGLSAVHQHVRIGKLSMLGAKAKAVMDVPPFSICEGQRAKFCGTNVVGLKRAGIGSKQAQAIKKALKILFGSQLNLSTAILQVKEEFKNNSDIDYVLSFIKNSKRGVSRMITEE
jgi:UDP-N-acetylglucosamine acyltransferase